MKALRIALLASLPLVAQTVPEIKFDYDPDFLKLPDNLHFGEPSGVAVNSKGNIYVFNRGNTSGPAFGAAASQLLEFDKTGKFIREIGKGLYAWAYAHTVRVDPQDNIWAVDKGSDMVVKFNPAGRVQMVFGRKQEASDETEPWSRTAPRAKALDGRFRQPTDVAWDPQGNIYISDGYVNSRVAKFDKNGDWVKQWGEFGAGAEEMNTPHSIANDRQGNLYVADRGNRRIKKYDGDGKLLQVITIDVSAPAGAMTWFGEKPAANLPPGQNSPGAPWAVCVSGGPTQYLYSADAYPGRIYKLSLDGKLLGMLGRTGRMPGTFGWIHEMACPSENELFVAEILNWRVQKLTLKPGK